MSGISSGALNVLTSQKNNHRITLVGEVPKGTMQRIFTGLHYRGVN
jgi:negative regulator of sigma E activity